MASIPSLETISFLSNLPTVESIFAVMETCKFTIYWRIENFNCEPSNNFSIESEIFRCESMESDWQIKMKVRGKNLDAYLHKKTNLKQFRVCYSIFLLTRSGWNTISANNNDRCKVGYGYGVEMVDLKRLKEDEWTYIPDGSLTISFQMWNYRTIRNSQLVMISRLRDENECSHRPIQTFSTLEPSDLFPFPFSFEHPGNAMASLKSQNIKTQHTQTDTNINLKDSDDLRKVFLEKEFSFVTLRTSTKEFSLHKAVLCAKSPVFNAMFERKMKENDSNVVDIDDIDSLTMTLFVKFLHFEPLGDLKWSAAVSLYYAADKYQIDSLKKECTLILNKELSVENVCDLLLLADLHQDNYLMNYAQEYFCKHSRAILHSTQWKDILGNTELVGKVLWKLAETRL